VVSMSACSGGITYITSITLDSAYNVGNYLHNFVTKETPLLCRLRLLCGLLGSGLPLPDSFLESQKSALRHRRRFFGCSLTRFSKDSEGGVGWSA
jgi:hypothetical protein